MEHINVYLEHSKETTANIKFSKFIKIADITLYENQLHFYKEQQHKI